MTRGRIGCSWSPSLRLPQLPKRCGLITIWARRRLSRHPACAGALASLRLVMVESKVRKGGRFSGRHALELGTLPATVEKAQISRMSRGEAPMRGRCRLVTIRAVRVDRLAPITAKSFLKPGGTSRPVQSGRPPRHRSSVRPTSAAHRPRLGRRTCAARTYVPREQSAPQPRARLPLPASLPAPTRSPGSRLSAPWLPASASSQGLSSQPSGTGSAPGRPPVGPSS